MGFGEKDHKGKMSISSYHIKGIYCQHGHHCQCKPWSPGQGGLCQVLHCKVTLSLPTVEELCFTLLGVEICIDYLECFWKGELSLLIYLFIQSFIYVSMDSWIFIFILWVIIQYNFIFTFLL